VGAVAAAVSLRRRAARLRSNKAAVLVRNGFVYNTFCAIIITQKIHFDFIIIARVFLYFEILRSDSVVKSKFNGASAMLNLFVSFRA
jgi:hypothetical protein